MGLGYKNNIKAAVTAVSNTFIDEYMGTASGEYVKVYLYLLRHAGESVEIPDIADALNHTEADVRRALAYWERAGVLAPEKEETVVSESAVTRENMTDTGYMAPESRRNYGILMWREECRKRLWRTTENSRRAATAAWRSSNPEPRISRTPATATTA